MQSLAGYFTVSCVIVSSLYRLNCRFKASSSAGGSTAGLRIGALGPAGARGSAGVDLARGNRLRVPGATGSGHGTDSSGASGAGAPGLTGSVAVSSRAVVRDDADACEPLRVTAPVPGRPTPCSRVSRTRHSPGTKVCISEPASALARQPGQSHTFDSEWGNRH